MYLTMIKPNIMFVVSLISIFMESPKRTHWKTRKMILRYMIGTTNYGIMYTSNSDFKLTRYTNIDFVGCTDDRKSRSGYVFDFGLGAAAWASKKDPIVTLSFVKVEYVAITTTAC